MASTKKAPAWALELRQGQCEALDRLGRIEAAVSRTTAPRAMTDRRPLGTIAAIVGRQPFLAHDIMLAANVDEALRVELDACCLDTALLLGARLRRLEKLGAVVGVRRTRAGMLWRL